jgi:hypothetical protein
MSSPPSFGLSFLWDSWSLLLLAAWPGLQDENIATGKFLESCSQSGDGQWEDKHLKMSLLEIEYTVWLNQLPSGTDCCWLHVCWRVFQRQPL